MHKNWSLKKGGRILRFEDVVLFNRALDNGKTIWKNIRKSAVQPPNISKTVRVSGIFRLFGNAGSELSEQKFRTFLFPPEQKNRITMQKDIL